MNQSSPAVPVGQRDATLRGEPALEDRGERVREEERHEGRGHERGCEVPAAAQRRTARVHSSIQRSRLRPISAAGSCERPSWRDGVAAEGVGQWRPGAHRQHEHALGHRRLEALREHEVDQGVGAVHVLRPGEHAGELDLAEAAVGDGGGRGRRAAAWRRSPPPPGSLRTRRRSAGFPCCLRRRRSARCRPPPSRRRRAPRSPGDRASSPASRSRRSGRRWRA